MHNRADIKIMLSEMQKRKGKKDDAANNEDLRDANKQKINIFDQQDSTVLKQETLAKLGYDERALVPYEDKSETVSVRSAADERPKAIEYLNKSRQQKETVRDFIDNSRKILMAGLSIIDKTEETQLLQEYIQMEHEKLEEGQKTFKEDQDIYDKVKNDLQMKSQQTEEECRRTLKANEELLDKINQL